MGQENTRMNITKLDSKEFELPETLFVRDIENRVFQGIIVQCLAEIDGISLVAGNFIDHILGGSLEGVKGIHAEQDSKSQSIGIKVEVNIDFGISIPDKAEEIQQRIADEVTKLTGLHVSCVHVIFKNILPSKRKKAIMSSSLPTEERAKLLAKQIEEEYTDDF